jgi:hypothetical protein
MDYSDMEKLAGSPICSYKIMTINKTPTITITVVTFLKRFLFMLHTTLEQ